MSDEYGKLSLDIDQVTRKQTVTYDTAIFDKVRLFASEEPVKCSTKDDCLSVHLEFIPKVPFMDNIIVGTQVWNYDRESWNNYFNHGIMISGETMNDMVTLSVIDHKGKMHHVQYLDKTLQDKITVIDLKSGKIGSLLLDNFVPADEKTVQASTSALNREGSVFQQIRKGEAESALQTAKLLYPNAYNGTFNEINDIFFYEYGVRK